MVVGLVIHAGRPNRNMADQRVRGYFKLSALKSGSFHAFGFKRRRTDIGNEIGLPKIFQPFFIVVGRYVEVALIAGKTLGEASGTIEDKTRISQHVHHERRGGYPDKPGRLSASVNQAVPGIERRGKHTPLAPLEHLLFLAFLPNFGRALSLDDANDLLIEMSLGFQGSARRYLRYIHSRDPLHSI